MASTAPTAGPVRALDKSAVHKICSGQVILSLATAVKELVENSLDAGSTSVDVRLKNYGSELVEVTDNGPGVKEDDFQALTLKHHTSKVKEFEDLVTVGTFGFRGEALSSLCELSDVTITTRHNDSSVGYKIEYDHHGNLTRKTPCASQVGTTVELTNLFATLPVRHKEFTKNLKREFSKMLQVLYGYCLIATGVRFTCSHQNAQGKKSILLSTRGNDAIRENIVDVFGSKQLSSLLEFQQHDPNSQVLEDYGITFDAAISNKFRFDGFVSSCQHGLGRSSSDRQFYYINGRPCDPVKVSKSVNEVYHSYNRHQYPVVVLNICLNKDAVDVNVTPDKRQLLLSNETWLLAVLKSSLLMMYEKTPSTLDVSIMLKPSFNCEGISSQLLAKINSPENDESSQTRIKKKIVTGSFKRRFSLITSGNQEEKMKDGKQPRLDKFLSFSSPECKKTGSGNLSPDKNCVVKEQFDLKDDSIKDELVNYTESNADEERALPNVFKVSADAIVKPHEVSGKNRVQLMEQHNKDAVLCENKPNAATFVELSMVAGEEIPEEDSEQSGTVSVSGEKIVDSSFKLISSAKTQPVVHSKTRVAVKQECVQLVMPNNEDHDSEEICERKLVQDSTIKKSRKVVEVSYSLENHVQKQLPKSSQQHYRKFRAKFEDNEAAESELQREITKEMFSEMQIIGQFNLGFIIAKLGTDLFIVDQHASDEKYNFETLMKQTVLDNQKLIRPLPLDLTAASEGILLENMDIFEKNGFKFFLDESAQAPKRVMLTSIPLSKGWLFGKEDIEELIFMLSDAQGIMCRPSRIQQMFASRACRKSVMIGKHLNQYEMKKLVRHMGELEQPWNCPHGRPTLRHLLSLNLLPD